MTDNNWPEIPGYRIESELGRGGMATVYLAVQESLQRQVALKVMKAVLAADEEFAERFVREARTAASLQHSSIVSIFDAGQAGHQSYIAMEYVAGGELKDSLHHGALKPAEAVTVLRQLAAGLDYAHGKGFVHRDVKPENILFREDGTAVLSDFGIARAIGSGTRMTATGLSIGTPHYMSPEQARGQAVDGRSDLYALGVVFFEMLSGQVPFDAQDSFAVGLQHINDPIPQLRPVLAQYQPLIDRLLAKDPADRYQTGAELIDDLDRIEQGQTIAPRRAGTRVVRRFEEQGARNKGQGPRITDQGAGITDPGKGAGQRSGLYWGLGGAVLAAVLAVGLYLWQDQQSSPPSIGGTSTVSRPAPTPALASEPETATPETGNRQPETASSGSAILYLTTTPEGAEVFLNDYRLGQTPFESDTLPAGEHRLRLVHRYYEPWEQPLRLEEDVVERIEAELQRGTGRVTVTTDPQGAAVWINGEPQPGFTPLTISNLRSGDLQLEIRQSQYRTEAHEVEIIPGETARLDLQLEDGDLYEWEGRWLLAREVVPLMLENARNDLANGRLTIPDDSNAHDKYIAVLDIDPANTEAIAGIERIKADLLELAENALQGGRYSDARDILDSANQIGVDKESINPIIARIETEQTNQMLVAALFRAEEALSAREVQLFDEAIEESIGLGAPADEIHRLQSRMRAAVEQDQLSDINDILERAQSVANDFRLAESRSILQQGIRRYPNAAALGSALSKLTSSISSIEADRYIRNMEIGTAIDITTGLEWMICAIGQTWTGGTCSGEPIKVNAESAMSEYSSGYTFAGRSDWRIPTRSELRTLTYCDSGNPSYWPKEQFCQGRFCIFRPIVNTYSDRT